MGAGFAISPPGKEKKNISTLIIDTVKREREREKKRERWKQDQYKYNSHILYYNYINIKKTQYNNNDEQNSSI